MINPISPSTLFDTPTTIEDLHDWCMMHSGSERTIALVASGMAINLCSQLIDAALSKESVECAKESVE